MTFAPRSERSTVQESTKIDATIRLSEGESYGSEMKTRLQVEVQDVPCLCKAIERDLAVAQATASDGPTIDLLQEFSHVQQRIKQLPHQLRVVFDCIHEVGLGSVLDKHADVVFKQKQMELFKRFIARQNDDINFIVNTLESLSEDASELVIASPVLKGHAAPPKEKSSGLFEKFHVPGRTSKTAHTDNYNAGKIVSAIHQKPYNTLNPEPQDGDSRHHNNDLVKNLDALMASLRIFSDMYEDASEALGKMELFILDSDEEDIAQRVQEFRHWLKDTSSRLSLDCSS